MNYYPAYSINTLGFQGDVVAQAAAKTLSRAPVMLLCGAFRCLWNRLCPQCPAAESGTNSEAHLKGRKMSSDTNDWKDSRPSRNCVSHQDQRLRPTGRLRTELALSGDIEDEWELLLPDGG